MIDRQTIKARGLLPPGPPTSRQADPSKKDEPPDQEGAVITACFIEDRKRARSIEHLMNHSPPCATCEGCQAKAREKKHLKGSFDASPVDHSRVLTMEQVSIQDFDSTAGYGGYKYGIVLCSLRTEFWECIPLRSLSCNEAHAAPRQFCIAHQLRSTEGTVYATWKAPLSSIPDRQI